VGVVRVLLNRCRYADEQTAMPQSKAGKQIVMKLLKEAQEAAEKGDSDNFSKILEKLNKTPV
jgi:hypothetical protein